MSHGPQTADRTRSPGDPVASVVIPAHNEGSVIDACLQALAADPVGPRCEVVVAANGCTDDTVACARGFADRLPHLTVLDLDTASKVAALNAGDAAAGVLPRIYLDADIRLGDGALGHLVDTLTTADAVVSSPHIDFDLTGADPVVREFYRMFTALPYVQRGLIGLGVYGLSASGRARFGEFPELTADDLFVQRLFRDDERRISAGRFTVRVPRTAAALLKVRTRVARGNAELAGQDAVTLQQETLDTSESTGGTVRAMLDVVRRRPTMLPAAATYLGVTVLARLRAARTATPGWERDDSTRQQDA